MFTQGQPILANQFGCASVKTQCPGDALKRQMSRLGSQDVCRGTRQLTGMNERDPKDVHFACPCTQSDTGCTDGTADNLRTSSITARYSPGRPRSAWPVTLSYLPWFVGGIISYCSLRSLRTTTRRRWMAGPTARPWQAPVLLYLCQVVHYLWMFTIATGDTGDSTAHPTTQKPPSPRSRRPAKASLPRRLIIEAARVPSPGTAAQSACSVCHGIYS